MPAKDDNYRDLLVELWERARPDPPEIVSADHRFAVVRETIDLLQRSARAKAICVVWNRTQADWLWYSIADCLPRTATKLFMDRRFRWINNAQLAITPFDRCESAMRGRQYDRILVDQRIAGIARPWEYHERLAMYRAMLNGEATAQPKLIVDQIVP